MHSSKQIGTLLVVVGVCACAVFGREIPEDLDPRVQIAQHNTDFGQLRASDDTLTDDEANVFDDVMSSEEDDAERSLPGFPPSLEFNREGNRVHKRIPVLEEEYEHPYNKMIEINKEA